MIKVLKTVKNFEIRFSDETILKFKNPEEVYEVLGKDNAKKLLDTGMVQINYTVPGGSTIGYERYELK